MINLSSNEASSLTKLAARGVGYSWGLCEEAALTVRWLSSRDVSVMQALGSLFKFYDTQPLDKVTPQIQSNMWACSGVALCPLLTGSALSDRASMLATGADLELHTVIHPMLLVPFVSEVAVQLGQRVHISWNGLIVECDGQQARSSVELIEFSQRCQQQTKPLNVSLSINCEPLETSFEWQTHHDTRLQLSAACMQQFKQFAHRTYAPNTEQSRQLGAGAGESDND